jgi:hypothetical protein
MDHNRTRLNRVVPQTNGTPCFGPWFYNMIMCVKLLFLRVYIAGLACGSDVSFRQMTECERQRRCVDQRAAKNQSHERFGRRNNDKWVPRAQGWCGKSLVRHQSNRGIRRSDLSNTTMKIPETALSPPFVQSALTQATDEVDVLNEQQTAKKQLQGCIGCSTANDVRTLHLPICREVVCEICT